MTKPDLKEWKDDLQISLERLSNKKTDIQEILSICTKYNNEIQTVINWISDQAAFIEGIKRQYTQVYQIRFNEAPPPTKETPMTPERLLNTPQERKMVVRDIALTISKPGTEISDKIILEELTRRAIKLEADNPNAVISTILRGFTAEFEKVKEKRGTFKRKIHEGSTSV